MKKYWFPPLITLLLFASCKKESETFVTPSISDYSPLQTGKYLTYDLDSTIFTNFGQTLTIMHYQAQYRVDTATTDNLGRQGFIIRRYLRSDSTQPWAIDNVFTLFNTGKTLEFIQDNLRFLKLVLPIQEGYTWDGNTYLAFDPYRSYAFANPAFMEGWAYTYSNVEQPLSIGDSSFAKTITVLEVDDSIGDPKIAGTDYAEKTYSIEKYAKNVGLIYKDFIHWEYQSVDNTYKGFGERLSLIDHN